MPLDDLEFHVIAFLQALIAFACYRAVMNENIGSVIAADKTKALGIIEPFHFTLDAGHLHFPPEGPSHCNGRSYGLPGYS